MIKKFLKSDAGATAIEYGLIAAGVSVAIAVIVFTLGSKEKNAALVQRLDDQGIIVALRPLGVRVSPHFYNTEDDVARLLSALG